jgi:nicotinate-nucleotide adenylyltransferase
MRRIGLLGGTFDPPHVGHLVVAECARVELELDQVRLLVAGDPWMKSTESSARDRVALVRAAVQGAPGIEVDDREVRRGGPTYTADTLAELTDEEPDVAWHFLLGVDAAVELPRWERGAEALALATFVVVTRPGHGVEEATEQVRALPQLAVPELDISSTELRQRYREGGPTRFQVPPQVDDLVRDLGLYGSV